jgi:peptide/nickel transport system substrate-binding protein
LGKPRPDAVCELSPGTLGTHLLINRAQPPFDNPDLRRAMSLTIDRKAYIDTLGQEIGGILQPPPAGVWGMPPEQIAELPGYGFDVQKNLEDALALMRKLGYGPDNRLKIKVTTRDWSNYRDPAVLLIGQLKQIYIDGELDLVDTAQYFPKNPAKGIHGRAQRADGGARSRPDCAAVLRLRLEPQLGQLLQSGVGQDDRGAIKRG